MNKKAIALGTFLALQAASASAVCTYTLSSSISGLDPVYHADTAFPVVSGQTVEYTVQNATTPLYGATSSAGLTAISSAISSATPGGDIAIPASGIMAAEFNMNNFTTTATTGSVVMTFGFTTGNGAPNNIGMDGFELGVWIAALSPTISRYMLVAITNEDSNSDGTRESYNRVTNTNASLASLASGKIGVYINGSTRRFGYTLNGVDKGYVTDFSGNPMYIPSAVSHVSLMIGGTTTSIPTGDPVIGTPVGGTLVTDAALMTQPFPAGAKDICGNTI